MAYLFVCYIVIVGISHESESAAPRTNAAGVTMPTPETLASGTTEPPTPIPVIARNAT